MKQLSMKKKLKKRKKPERDKIKNPALNKHYNSKVRQEYIDYDYLSKLTNEEKEWLNNFTEEYLNANFKHNGKKLYKKKKDKQEIYNQNNARNRCLYSKNKIFNNILTGIDIWKDDVDILHDEDQIINEDDIIDIIDKKKKSINSK